MIQVRRARPDEAGRIADIYIASWRDTYPGLVPSRVLKAMCPERLGAKFRAIAAAPAGRETLLVAATGPALLGMASLGPNSDRELDYDYDLFTLYVDPAQYGGGSGRALLQGAFAETAQLGGRSLLVWVLARNPARFFYEAQGADLVASRQIRRWGVRLDMLGYAWPDLAAAMAEDGDHPEVRRRQV